MRFMFLYEYICRLHNEHGKAVHSSVIVDGVGWSRSKTYKTMKVLVDEGFLIKPQHGWYIPADIYQWSFDDVK